MSYELWQMLEVFHSDLDLDHDDLKMSIYLLGVPQGIIALCFIEICDGCKKLWQF